MPSNIGTIATKVAQGIVTGVLSGGALAGQLLASHFPLAPLLIGLMLAGFGVILKMRGPRLKPRHTESVS